MYYCRVIMIHIFYICRTIELRWKTIRQFIELSKRREVTWPQTTMFYFDYQRNTIGLYWEWKVTFLKNDIIGFTIRQKCRKVVKMKKCVEPSQKQTKDVTFFSQNSQLTFSLPKEKYFHIKDKNRPLLRKKLNFF